jgi:hypothetical protein
MKDATMPPRHWNIVRRLRDVLARVGTPTWQSGLAPVRSRCRPGWNTAGRTPRRSTGWVPLVMGLALLAASPAAAAAPTLPTAIPNFHDPAVRAHYHAVEIGPLGGNPDFPMLLLMNTDGARPHGLLLGLDARNGKDTWSFAEDPVIFIAFVAAHADEAMVEAMYVDVGFVDEGKASGTFATVDPADSAILPELLKAVAPAAQPTRAWGEWPPSAPWTPRPEAWPDPGPW